MSGKRPDAISASSAETLWSPTSVADGFGETQSHFTIITVYYLDGLKAFPFFHTTTGFTSGDDK